MFKKYFAFSEKILLINYKNKYFYNTKINMLSYIVVIIILLIIIFIVCFYNFLQNKKCIILKNKEKVSYEVYSCENLISYFTKYLKIDKNTTYVIYYDLSLNSVYWTVGLYNEKCINYVNIGKFQTIETGDTLAIIIGNNANIIKETKKKVKLEHDCKFPYKKLLFDFLHVDEDFYIHFQSFSNKFLHKPNLKIYEYSYADSEFNDCLENFKKIKENETKETKGKNETIKYENYELFNLAKIDYIDKKYKSVKVNVNTNEPNISKECFTNRSEDIKNNGKFIILAVDHFKSKVALHSNIIFYNSFTNEPFNVQITGEISDRLNSYHSISIRKISFDIPECIKNFYCVEYIYSNSTNSINENMIIPMEIFIF
jgi:hypothetical protein